MWTRCELQIWSIDDTLYATPQDDVTANRMQREWARLVGAELLPLAIPAGAHIMDVTDVNGSLARCTIDELEVLMSVALVGAEPN